MSEDSLPARPNTKVLRLQEEINILQLEINEILLKTTFFENQLRTGIEDQILLEQELSLLYKQQKQAKKEKRRKQKIRSKDYRPTTQLQPRKIDADPVVDIGELHQKKRLYREAMLHVHPDKFSMQTAKLELATEITAQLIQIYKEGNLAALQAYHAHIFSGNTSLPLTPPKEKIIGSGLDFLKRELNRLEQELHRAKNKHTYKVLTEYENPMHFLEELKAFYKDRILKLKRRTRTK